MKQLTGRLTDIWREGDDLVGRIRCPVQLGPGQYALAQRSEGNPLALPTVLFNGGQTADGFISGSPLPAHWRPGDDLLIKGPLGKGFQIPQGVRRLGLLALATTQRCLLALAEIALKNGISVALAFDERKNHLQVADLPSAIEIIPWDTLPELLAWSDQLAIDLALSDLAGLRPSLGIQPGDRLPCPAQVLLHTAMPCGAAADCGVCAVKMKHGWKLACKDGPVFILEELDW